MVDLGAWKTLRGEVRALTGADRTGCTTVAANRTGISARRALEIALNVLDRNVEVAGLVRGGRS